MSLPVTVVNSYAYAGNSPLRLTDPSGRSFLGDLILGVLITAAAVFTAGIAAQFMVGLFSAAGTAFAPLIGAVSGAVTGGIAGGIVGAIGYGVQGRSAAEGFVAGMIQGAIAGAVAGAIVGANVRAPSGSKNPAKQLNRNINALGDSEITVDITKEFKNSVTGAGRNSIGQMANIPEAAISNSGFNQSIGQLEPSISELFGDFINSFSSQEACLVLNTAVCVIARRGLGGLSSCMTGVRYYCNGSYSPEGYL